MPSRREQIQSYQYLMQRVVNAFMVGDTDPAQPPLRRLAGAGFASIMVTALVVAAVGVFGLIRHGGNSSWQDEHVVVIEKETGTRYVYRAGTLYPVANYVSALLVIGGAAPTVSVSRESLVGAARGPLIGIAGAPDALPPASRLLGAPWSVCAQPGADSETALTWLVAGRDPGPGSALGDRGVLALDTSGRGVYLLWNGHRYLTANRTVLTGMGVDQQPRVPVDPAWLNAVPAGETLASVSVDSRGKASTAVPGALVGQVLALGSGDSAQYYLVRAADLQPLTPLQEALTLADTATAAAYPGATPAPVPVTAAQLAGVKVAGQPEHTDASPPDRVPAMVQVPQSQTVCAEYRDAASPPSIVVGVPPITANAGIATNGPNSGSAALVDRVLVPAGYAAVVAAAPAPDSTVTQLYLVTDQGRRYPVPDAAELGWLGYANVTPLVLPAGVVTRIPAGPALDPLAATQPVPAG